MDKEVCLICGIAGCYHLEERREAKMNENARLRAALVMAKKHMIVNDLSLPNVFAVIDAALTPAPEAPKDGEGGMLLPCPFCGRKAKASEDYSHHDRQFSVECSVGHSDAWVYPTKAEAIAAWNRRATPSPGADFKAGLMRAADMISVLEDACVDEMVQLWAKNRRSAIFAEAEKITSSDAGGAHGCAVQTSQPGGASASSVPAPLTLRAGKRYRDGNGEVIGPVWLSSFNFPSFTDGYMLWNPDGTLAGGAREDKRSLVAEVVE